MPCCTLKLGDPEDRALPWAGLRGCLISLSLPLAGNRTAQLHPARAQVPERAGWVSRFGGVGGVAGVWWAFLL